MQKTLAQNAALTGGVASSAATAAAQQANNYYNAQLADRIPQLYADAYNRYLQDYQMSQDKLNTLMRLSDTDYDRYDTNRKFDFNIYQDRYGQARDYFDALNTLYGNNYDQYRTQLDQYNKDRNFDFDVWAANEDNRRYVEEMQNKAAQDQYNALMDLYKLGYDQEQAEKDRAYNEEQDRLNWDYKYAALNNSGGGRSSGGSGGSGSGSGSGSGGTGGTGGTGSGTGSGTGGEGDTGGDGSIDLTPTPVKGGSGATFPVYTSDGNKIGEYTTPQLNQFIANGYIEKRTVDGKTRYVYVSAVPNPNAKTNKQRNTEMQ